MRGGTIRLDGAELRERGFCVLRGQFDRYQVAACREAFLPVLERYTATHESNRGPGRFCVPMPFRPPCFAPEFFSDAGVLGLVRAMMDERVVADQWHCDVALPGSVYQAAHVDYRRPLFAEAPGLQFPPYMLVVSFGLDDIGPDDGPIEIAPGTQLSGSAPMEPIPLAVGDVLIRHPWALHRGSPNRRGKPRMMASIRWVRRWYADDSREVETMPHTVWESLTREQREILRFPRE